MNCPICKSKIQQEFKCNQCPKSFCTNKCLNFHISANHKLSNSKNIRPSLTRSIFMKSGVLLKKIVEDPYFEIKNFEFVRNSKNKIITLGTGAYGRVILSKSLKDKKYYAIKHIKKQRVIEAGQSLDAMYREILIQRSLVHENIVRLYSYTEDQEGCYLIMEFLNNGTLFSEIRKNNGMDEKKAFSFFIQAVAAVHFLHENGYIHRDLKPENLLIDKEGHCKLCDFGWCVEVSDGERATFCGTYEYMAPEIVKESAYGYPIDDWSLGVLLYELIHGYSPFRAKKIGNKDNNCDDEENSYNLDDNLNENDKKKNIYMEIFKNIIQRKYTIDKNISKECKDLIEKLLNTDDKQRLKTKDIFSHPWVVGFEKEYKLNKIKESQMKKNNDNNKINEIKEITNNNKKMINVNKDNCIKKDLSNPIKINNNINQPNNQIFNNNVKIPSSVPSVNPINQSNNDKNYYNINGHEEFNEFCLLNSLNNNQMKEMIHNSNNINNINNNFAPYNNNINQMNYYNNNNNFNKGLNFIPPPANDFNLNSSSNNDNNINNINNNMYNEKPGNFLLNDNNNNKNSNNRMLENAKLFIDQTPTPMEAINDVKRDKDINIMDVIGILEQSEQIKKENIPPPKIKLINPEENFFTRLFSQFNCGNFINKKNDKKEEDDK